MSTDKSKLEIRTFGCRLNFYESEVMRSLVQEAGLDGDVIIFNTCAVTKEAERQARQALERPKRRIKPRHTPRLSRGGGRGQMGCANEVKCNSV